MRDQSTIGQWSRATCFLLIGLLGFFAVVKLISGATWGELVGPYFAFAASMIGAALLFWGLKTWEQRAAPPVRLLALAASLVMAIFVCTVNGAWGYLALVLGVIHPGGQGFWDDLGDWRVALPLLAVMVLSASIPGYQYVIKSRATAKAVQDERRNSREGEPG